MISSDELREHLSAYLDGQLSGYLLTQMEQRLQEDDRLRAELEELRELVASLASFPSVDAPPGFTDRVMAGVDGLPVPISGGLDELAERGESDHDSAADYMNVPWWLKSSIALSAAAALVLGFLVIRAPLKENPVDFGASSDMAEVPKPWGLPMATGGDLQPEKPVLTDAGADETEADGDAVAAVEDDEELPATSLPPASPPQATPPPAPAAKKKAKVSGAESRQASASSTARSSAERKRRKASGLREVAADREFPAGVFQAPHEDSLADAGESGAVFGRAAASSGMTKGDVAGPAAEQVPAQPAPSARDGDQAAADDGGGADDADGVVALEEEPAPASQSEPEPAADKASEAAPPEAAEAEAEAIDQVNDSLVEVQPADVRGAPRRGGGSGRSSRTASTSDTQVASVPVEVEESVVVVSGERGQENQNAPSIAVKLAIGRLYLEGAGVITALTRELRAKGWSVDPLTVLPRSEDGSIAKVGKQILQIVVPGVAAPDLARLLSSYGTLNTDRDLSPAPDGKVRLRLTVRWGD